MNIQEKKEHFKKWANEETNYSEIEIEALVDGYGMGLNDGYKVGAEDLRKVNRENIELKLEKQERENNKTKDKELAELQGYKRVVEDLKKEGFDSYMSISEYVKKCSNRGKFIDWVLEHYPDVVKEYLGFTEKE